MKYEVNNLSIAVASIVILSWFGFALLFFLRKRPPKATQKKRDRVSLLGALLVGVGYALVWTIRRPTFIPLFDVGLLVDWIVAVVAIVLSIGCVVLVLTAVRTLGRQWSVEARLVDDHQLVTEGPYAIVRHPIYTGMLGMMIATGLAFSLPACILPAIAVAWYGTHLRIQREEALLREAFGEKYKEYSQRVPPLVPGVAGIR